MNTLPIPSHLLDPEIFAAHYGVDDETGCWNWTGNMAGGYGRVKANGKHYYAHRISCLIAGRPVDGLVIDHLCRNTRCVNPDHLEPTTVQVNTARGTSPTAAGATARLLGACINGHVIAIVGTHKQGNARTCAQCGRDRVARYNQRRGAA